MKPWIPDLFNPEEVMQEKRVWYLERDLGGSAGGDRLEGVLLQARVRSQSQRNRAGPVPFFYTVKAGRERTTGTVSAARSSDCFLQNIRSMNQTSHLENGTPPPAVPPTHALYLSPSVAQPPSLSPVLWIPPPVPSPAARKRKVLWWSLVTRVVFFIKPQRFKEASNF